MNTLPSSKSVSASVLVYRALLVAYPKKFREHYEIQMVQVFRDSFREAYHHYGMPGVIDLWLHTFLDLVFTALMERMSEGNQYMSSPKVVLWGGVAGICGGLFWMISGVASNGAGPLELGLVLGLGGLIGLYSKQAEKGGKLGLAGFALGIIGTVTFLAALWWGFTSGRFASMGRNPTLGAPGVLLLSLGMVILGIGISLLGVTSLRGKTLHRWHGMPLVLGLVNTLSGMTFWLAYYLPLSQGRNPWNPWNFEVYVLYPAVLATLGLCWLGVGIALAAEVYDQVVQPPPTSA